MAIASAEEALVFVGQIALRDDSHLSAMLAGGEEFIGWTLDRYLLADARDLAMASLLGNAGKKMTAEDLVPRPRRKEVIAPPTIADFDKDRFMRWLMS